MRHFVRPLFVIATLLAAAVPARASCPTCVVRDFFAALEQHDFVRARSLTDGAAADLIAEVLAAIDREAAQKHVQVELQVRRLDLVVQPANRAGQIPIDVEYDVAVFGRKWLIRHLARRLNGTVRFLMDGPSAHIAAIIGDLSP
jgi:hypothetical protein